MKIENDTIFMFELYRFDDSKKKESLKYIAPNKMIFEMDWNLLFYIDVPRKSDVIITLKKK